MEPQTMLELLRGIASVLASVIVGVSSSYLTFRLRFEAFKAMDKERERHWSGWREQITGDVETLKRTTALGEVRVIASRLRDMERRLSEVEQRWNGIYDQLMSEARRNQGRSS